MSERKAADDLSVTELQQLLYRKKRSERRSRLRRLKEEGRVVDVDGVAAPDPAPRLARPQANPTGAMRNYALQVNGAEGETNDSAPADEVRDQLALGA